MKRKALIRILHPSLRVLIFSNVLRSACGSQIPPGPVSQVQTQGAQKTLTTVSPSDTIQFSGAGASFPLPTYSEWAYAYSFIDPAFSPDWTAGSASSIKWPVAGAGNRASGIGNQPVADVVINAANSLAYVELSHAISNSLSCADMINQAGEYIHWTLTDARAGQRAAKGRYAVLPDAVRDRVLTKLGEVNCDAQPVLITIPQEL